ncbi:MAG: GlcNAc transferase, partial [Mesorhizobium sp.]
MNATSVERRTVMRRFALTAALLSGLALAGCQTVPTGEFTNIDKAQGSAENISSLSAVIQRSPQDPEGYNVRGSAYG